MGTATFLASIAGAAHGSNAVRAEAGTSLPAGHEHHGPGAAHAELIGASERCITTGEACLSHCLDLLGQGEKDLASCARTVRETIAACSALRELAAADSPHLRALAQVVGGVCEDCETECRKHSTHAICRECAAACRDCKTQCDKLAAAAG